MVLTSDFIDVGEAEKIGLVNQVVPPEQLSQVVFAMAQKIARNYPVAIRWMRSNLDLSSEVSQDAILHLESAVGEICRLSGVMTEGFTAKKQAIVDKEK
jgi:enoyl-CoA hydratase/carnithine racemase